MTLDQAAGLRVLLNQSPPEVLAVVPCGASAMHWVARQAYQRAALGQRVLAFDEWQISGNFSDCVGVAPRFDLQQAIEGQVTLEQCIVEAPIEAARAGQSALRVVSVARLAREIDGNRILQQRTQECLLRLQAASDEWLLVACPSDLTGLSSFARAAPRLLLVLEPLERAITEGYAALKRLARGADTLSVGIVVTTAEDAQARLLATRFRRVAASQLGIDVQAVTSLGEAMGMVEPAPAEHMTAGGSQGFAERLLVQARSHTGGSVKNASRGRTLAW